MEKLISIVVPIYNAEKFLDRCIQSIRNQTYNNLEIILVNDGSIDTSRVICEKYQSYDTRIILINQENKGVCRARKVGVESAKGTYIGFVDADDWIEQDMYEEMLKKLSTYHVDIVTCNMVLEYQAETLNNHKEIKRIAHIEEGIYTRDGKGKGYSYSQIYRRQGMLEPMITPSMSDKLFKIEIIKKHYMNIPDDIIMGEDFTCIASCIPFVETVYICDKSFYHYNRYNEQSSTKNEKPEYITSIINVYKYLKRKYDKHESVEFLQESLYTYFVDNLILNLPISIPYHFPIERTRLEGNIVLYGIGKVGKSYFKQLRKIEAINEIMLADKSKHGNDLEGIPIYEVKDMQHMKYDLIIICVLNELVANTIRQDLVEQYQIPANKIVWKDPIRVRDMIFPE